MEKEKKKNKKKEEATKRDDIKMCKRINYLFSGATVVEINSSMESFFFLEC